MNTQQKQLDEEIELLLLHLEVPTEEAKKKLIASKKSDFLSLKQQLSNLPPPTALRMLNEILNTIGYPYQISFFNDQDAKENVMNNPAVCHLFALVLSFLATPLKKGINTNEIEQKKTALIELTKHKKLNIEQGLEVMSLCKQMIQEIIKIIDRCEQEAGHRKPAPLASKAKK